MTAETLISGLLNKLPQQGELTWIGIRPASDQPMKVLQQTEIKQGQGLLQDRFKGRKDSKRQVTLIQYEHLAAIASLLDVDEVKPETLRRNLVVRGINLLALKNQKFSIGEVILQTTDLCHPCSKMEKVLGEGGYNAMRGHGGITAKVIKDGTISLGDPVKLYIEDNS